MHPQLTSQQFKIARATAQLSQARVAADLQINRTYISQFESGKYLFDDATLGRINDYFAQKGVQPESPGSVTQNPPPLQSESYDIEQQDSPHFRDGFAIPEDADEDRVESLLTEYAEGRRRIGKLCALDLSQSGFLGLWLDEEVAENHTNEVLALMARNFALVEELQGHAAIFLTATENDTGDEKTVLDFVRARLTRILD